jgi:phospholipid/cholesterol/gamma-HCH transport system substrate-binding protein
MADRSRSHSRKLLAGAFSIAAAALAVLAFLAFGGRYMLSGGDAYYVEYEGTVYGLEDGANVYMSGVRVGSVDTIALSPTDPRRVRVRIVVESGTPVRADTRAMLQLTGITGLKEIDLRDGTPEALPLPPGSTIAAGETTLDKLERRASEIADQTLAMAERANRILSNLAVATDPDGELLVTARRAIADVAAAGAALRAIAGESREGIRRSIDAVDRTASTVDSAIAELANLIRDNSGTVSGALSDLRQASRSLKDLAREVRQRPSRLLFSGAPQDRKLP